MNNVAMWLSLFSLYVMMWRMMKRIDVTVNNEGNGRDDGIHGNDHRPPPPLRYCGQIIVDKSIGINVLYPSKFPWERYSTDRRSLVFPPKRYSDKRRSSV